MSRWDENRLAQALADNPHVKLARESPRTVAKAQTATVVRIEGESPVKARKYRNEPVTVDGQRFASKKEAARYQELLLMQRAGEIRDLVCQWRYPLEVNGVHVCFYVADFVYTTREGQSVVEDCKGMRTPVYKLKAKLMFGVYGIKIKET